jgi:hypothetical protein
MLQLPICHHANPGPSERPPEKNKQQLTNNRVVLVAIAPGVLVADGGVFVRLLFLHDEPVVFIRLAA